MHSEKGPRRETDSGVTANWSTVVRFVGTGPTVPFNRKHANGGTTPRGGRGGGPAKDLAVGTAMLVRAPMVPVRCKGSRDRDLGADAPLLVAMS
jgi:hypothetical protein